MSGPRSSELKAANSTERFGPHDPFVLEAWIRPLDRGEHVAVLFNGANPERRQSRTAEKARSPAVGGCGSWDWRRSGFRAVRDFAEFGIGAVSQLRL
jgi:hypothetical protein